MKHERYLRKAADLIGERIDAVRDAFDESWTGALIGGGTAMASMVYDPVTRSLSIESHRSGDGEMSGTVHIDIGS